MASNKRKQDEKHLKMLREMVSLPNNKQCFDCHQRGPTYVNMTIGSFVCTSCSGILRGLNPPHRVKSISMASFTPEEMEFLKCHGNELNRKVYLGLYDSRSWPEPDSRDEQRVRDYMVQKYENKRWYVAPTEAMKEDAKRANEAALNSKPQQKPLRSLLGENASKMALGQPAPISQPPVSAPQVPMFKNPPPTSNIQLPASTKPSSGFDLLGELGGDPFASSAPATSNNTDGGFADFSNFDSMSSAPSHPQPVSLPPSQPPLGAFPISNTPLQPMGTGLTPTSSHPAPSSTAPAPASASNGTTNFSAISDKYAALADLDSAFSAPATTATAINWGGIDSTVGGGGVGINWGGSSSGSAVSSPQGGQGVSWSGVSSTSGGTGWTTSPAGMTMGSSPSQSAGFGTPSTANPFGAGPSPAFTTPASTVNPFGVPNSMAMPGQFSQAGNMGVMSGMPASSAATPGFAAAGNQFASPGSQFGQFPPMQNGGFGGAAPAGGFGASPAYSQQQFMMASQQQPVMQQTGWGQMGGMQAPSQPVANPFMNTAMQQQVPPPSGSTNPFL